MTLRDYLVQELAAMPDWFLVLFVLSALVGACIAAVGVIAIGFRLYDSRESSSGDSAFMRQLDAQRYAQRHATAFDDDAYFPVSSQRR